MVTDVKQGQLFDYYDVPKGAVITKVNGVAVNSVADIEKALPTSRDGQITISGISDNRMFTISFNN